MLTFAAGWVLPYAAYRAAGDAGIDLAGTMYIVALLLTGILIWVEGFASLRVDVAPEVPAAPYPPASAIIAAYLPNEAVTIAETIETFLEVDYPQHLQVILAYNTPTPHPVEAVFAKIAARDPRFVPYRVADGTSKAQNVNAALALVTGEFVGVFDADHHPAADSFTRAWRWLDAGADVVQGHPVVRNGEASRIARTVAVEFEAIYAVSHPGRARVHGFGIFGGSNGYDDAVRAVAAAALGRVGGWDVSTASSGVAGIEAARQLLPDAIVLDVMMPEIDGPTVLQHLRRDPATRDIPVVFLTARVAGPGHGALDAMEVSGLLIKPFDPMTLSRDLSAILGFGP